MNTMRRFLLLSLALCGVFFTTSCKKGNVEAELRSVIERNLKGNQNEDMDMALMDIDDNLKEATKKIDTIIFSQYDLSYTLLDFKVISVKNDTAIIEIRQETKKIKGPAFRDNIITAVHTLKKRPNGWKIADTQIKKTEFL